MKKRLILLSFLLAQPSFALFENDSISVESIKKTNDRVLETETSNSKIYDLLNEQDSESEEESEEPSHLEVIKVRVKRPEPLDSLILQYKNNPEMLISLTSKLNLDSKVNSKDSLFYLIISSKITSLYPMLESKLAEGFIPKTLNDLGSSGYTAWQLSFLRNDVFQLQMLSPLAGKFDPNKQTVKKQNILHLLQYPTVTLSDKNQWISKFESLGGNNSQKDYLGLTPLDFKEYFNKK